MEENFSDPFSISPNPLYLYLTPTLKATLHKIRYTINRRQGLTCVLGGVGYGKSTMLRFVFTEFDARDDIIARLIPTPNYASEFAFLKAICKEFDLPNKRSMLDQESELKDYLVRQYTAGRNVVVFIDEAQRLTNKMLELVRSMLNYETSSAKLVQIILSGQLELHDRLISDQMEALASRVVMPTILNTLSFSEVREMIEFRCEKAEIHSPFTASAYDQLFRVTGGIPREVLKIAGAAYEYMRMTEANTIEPELVEVAIREGTLKRQKAAVSNE